MSLTMTWQEQDNAVAKVIAQAWMDDAFKARLIQEPLAVLKAAGVLIPNGASIEVVEGGAAPREMVTSAESQGVATYSINIPAKPSDISDEDLSKVNVEIDARLCASCFCCM